ncbi:ABC transporter ATP-binding protein [Corynebacterium cystitidis]|uniref:ABC transporter ATP-binding protein n=1 Tax=Corynebacterium cystitidis TaxID=35757 RepID=UPI00211E2AFD|nr:ATP-binding cassette domain-containing protein [Corynebacterium cystitidis]
MSAVPALELHGVSVSAGDKEICHDVDLVINEGEKHLLLGPNGSGKSSLLAGIMGISPFKITAGTALFYGDDLKDMPVEERAEAGIGLAYQRPPSLQGVQVKNLAAAIGAAESLEEIAGKLQLSHLIGRNVNVGFSGGETKRFEVLKLALQSPALCLFDEPESGVDLEQVDTVGKAISQLLDSKDSQGRQRSGLVITHTGFILDGIDADVAHMMVDGTIVAAGDAHEMFENIRTRGYRTRSAS